MIKGLLYIFLGFMFAPMICLDANAENRTAIVIGNSAYRSAPLTNPVNDAKDMASALKAKGFEVTLKLNATLRDMKDTVRIFGKDLSQRGGVGLFYYAGHGMQLNGRNFLIPSDATIESEADVEFESLDAGLVLSKMEDAGNDINIVILDACRNNPFARNFRSTVSGLARMDAPKGSIIAYATAPGSVAADGEGQNGIYTKYLLENMKIPGLTMERILKNIRVAVVAETANKQIPWESSSLMGEFYFTPSTASSDQTLALPHEPENQEISNLPVPRDQEISFDDIITAAQKQETNQKRWEAWQEKRENDYTLVLKLDANTNLTPNQKKEAWQRFLAALNQDNPYSTRDEEMRQKAKEKLKDTDQAGMEKTKTEKLQKAKASLTIKAIPAGAQVKILNTQSRYVHGMELDPGQYNVEVSLTGYETVNLWQPLKQGQDLVLEIVLEKTRAIESSSSIPPLSETTVSSVEKSIIAPVKNETTEKEVSKPSSTMNEQFSNSGQFTKHQNGIVYDSKTGLEWFPGPDVKMNFRKAKVLVSSLSLDGGGWRMPSIYELKALQKDWITSKETAGLLPAASARVWYEDTVPGAYVYYYNFEIGQAYWEYPSYAPDCNAFAVRTRNRR